MRGGTAQIRLEPETILVSKGTCVIWNNWTGAQEVIVKFEEGKKCDDVTDAPVGFKLDAANCFVTDLIPFGGTSSLRFVEEGSYDYVVEALKAKAKGKIIVK